MFHEGSELLQDFIFLTVRHVLLTQQKADNGTEVLRSYTRVTSCRIVLLQKVLDVADKLGGKLKFTHVIMYAAKPYCDSGWSVSGSAENPLSSSLSAASVMDDFPAFGSLVMRTWLHTGQLCQHVVA